MKRALAALFVSLTCMYGSAEAISITQTNNAAALGAALGGGVNVTSVNGNALQFGTYTNGSGLWGIGPGIVMSSGNVTHYNDGPNLFPNRSTNFGTAGQADMTALAGWTSYDAATLVLNFVAASTQFSFDFVFGSEEYAEWVGSSFNDVFGAFIGGPGGTNITYDQFANPISINSAWMMSPTGTELDGRTILLTTTYGGLTVGNTYSLMFGIADSADHIYDSTVYLSNFRFGQGLPPGTNPKVPTPEPSTMLLLGSGLTAAAIFRKRLSNLIKK